jgi:GNAT superfamily N-acetyltransferase
MAGTAEYEFTSHAEIGDLAGQVYRLASLAFGQYAGVLRPSRAHRDWYVRRPGMDSRLSRAALCGGQLVGSVFVTVASVRLGGRLQPTGIVDTVMTDPGHRRRGLARRLLGEALQGMRARGLAASLLYTVPDSMPYHFYLSLGYRPHARVRYLRRTQPDGANAATGAPQRAQDSDTGELMAFLDACFAQDDGYVPMDEALWRWRKVDRPCELPARTRFVRDGIGIAACLTVCTAPIVGAGHAPVSRVLTDLAIAPGRDGGRLLASLLSTVAPGTDVLALSAEADRPRNDLLDAMGFVETGREVGMLLALSREVEGALSAPARAWYVLAESVIGV